jgi:hypothetical protein
MTSPSCDLVLCVAFVRFCSGVSPSCDFALSIAFVRFTIKNLHMLVGVKSIILAFGCWDDRAIFDELTIICLSIYLVTSV